MKNQLPVLGPDFQPECTIYTDGGFRPDVNRGGIGIVCICGKTGRTKQYSESFVNTTNNRMEIMALIIGLERFGSADRLRVVTDSKYVAMVASGVWAAKKNVDLWARVRALVKGKTIEYRWTKGHAHDKWNTRCDKLATEAMKTDREKSGQDLAVQGKNSDYRDQDANTRRNAINVRLDIPEKFRNIPLVDDPAAYARDKRVTVKCAESIKFFYENGIRNFQSYNSLKSGGKDAYSHESTEKLLARFGNDGPELRRLALLYLGDDGKADVCLRWYARGLPLDDCIRLVLIRMEIENNILAANRRVKGKK